jgi:hypothetical protein
MTKRYVVGVELSVPAENQIQARRLVLEALAQLVGTRAWHVLGHVAYEETESLEDDE